MQLIYSRCTITTWRLPGHFQFRHALRREKCLTDNPRYLFPLNHPSANIRNGIKVRTCLQFVGHCWLDIDGLCIQRYLSSGGIMQPLLTAGFELKLGSFNMYYYLYYCQKWSISSIISCWGSIIIKVLFVVCELLSLDISNKTIQWFQPLSKQTLHHAGSWVHWKPSPYWS